MKHDSNLKNNLLSAIVADEKERGTYSFDYWLHRHSYYHHHVISFYKSIVPLDKRVLHVQCKNGYILEAIGAYHGVGVDGDEVSLAIARKRYQKYQFYSALGEVPKEAYDYILLSFAAMEADDIHTLLTSLHGFCRPETRIIIESYRLLWAPVLWITQFLGLRRPTRLRNWVSPRDLKNFISVTGFQLVTSGNYILMPLKIPGISWLLNTIIAHLPLLNRLCLHHWILIRPYPRKRQQQASVSIIIPCRNEKGTIEAAVQRVPSLGRYTELIFVEGNSSDETFEEIKRVCAAYPDKNIRYYKQDGKGKGDAVRKGFSHARGEILVILDADLTTPPEELGKFYNVLINGYADFVNGSRVVYGMESKAMGFLAWVANHGFGWIVSWIMGQTVTDTLCGTKVMWKKDYQAIADNRKIVSVFDPFGDFDLLFGAAKRNLKIVDVPVHYKCRTYGKTNIVKLKEVWFLLWMCIRAWKILRVRQ